MDDVVAIVGLVATPFKLGRPVLAPTGREGDFDAKAVDCPNVFRFRDRWYMTHIGFDCRGHGTGLATSDDLIRWERVGMILDRGPEGAFDDAGAAALSVLGLRGLHGGHDPIRHRGRYWMTYHGNDEPGCEAGRGSIGLAWSRDLRTWTRHPGNPVLPHGPEGAWDGRFASDPIVFREGDLYVMFYYGFDGRLGPSGRTSSRDRASPAQKPCFR